MIYIKILFDSMATLLLITGPANKAIIPEINPGVGVKTKPKAYTLGIISEQPKTGLTTSSITSKIADANLEYSHTVLPLSDVPKTTAFSSAEVSQLKQTDSLCTAAKPHFQNFGHALDTHNYRFPTLHEPPAPPPRFAHVPESRPMVMGEPLPSYAPTVKPVLLSQSGAKLSKPTISAPLAPSPCVKMGMESGTAAEAQATQLTMNASTPASIFWGSGTLSARQKNILDRLLEPGAEIILHKSKVSVSDLACLTAETGDEFAMFTLGSRRLIVRGTKEGVEIHEELRRRLLQDNWTWSAHTHPGTRDIILNASGIPGDRHVLQSFGQERSLILNSAGRRNVFDTENDIYISTNKHNFKVTKK